MYWILYMWRDLVSLENLYTRGAIWPDWSAMENMETACWNWGDCTVPWIYKHLVFAGTRLSFLIRTHFWEQKCPCRPTLRSAAVTSLPSSSPAGRKAFTCDVIFITTTKLHQAMLNKPCQEILPGRELAEEPLQSGQWTSQQMVHLTLHQWPHHQEAPAHMFYFALQSICGWPYPDTNLDVWKNGLEVTELNRGGRLTSPSRSRGRHWYSWSCSRTEANLFWIITFCF